MNKLFTYLCGLALCSTVPFSSHAQVVLKGINGSKTTLTPLSVASKQIKTLSTKQILTTDYVKSPNHYFAIAFSTIPSAEVQQIIKQYATIESYIPDYIYLLSARNAEQAEQNIRTAIADKASVLGSGNIPLAFKLSEELYQLAQQDAELTEAIKQKGLLVAVRNTADLPALLATLDRWQLTYSEETEGVRITSGHNIRMVQQIANIPYVSSVAVYVEPQPERSIEEKYFGDGIPMVNYDLQGITGQGTYFMNWEVYGAAAYSKINTRGRHVEGASDSRSDNHGTEVLNTAVGANNSVEYYDSGMAPGMTVMSGNTGPYANHENGAVRAIKAGYAPLVSNWSVGFGVGETAYNAKAVSVDKAIFENGNYVHCYSSGNSGNSTTLYNGYQLQAYGSFTGGMKAFKNGITVGAIINKGEMATYPNFGPSKDGRMKPEVVGVSSGGTSFSSPSVAGIMGLLYEQYMTTYPTSDLKYSTEVAKAVLFNTATDSRRISNNKFTEIGIDYRTGYGLAHAEDALRSIREQRVSFGEKILQGETKTHTITLPEGQTELRILLYYNDPPGTVGASKALINDLDLEVITPSGQTILPWTLDPDSVDNAMTKPPVRRVNRLDNHEQVVLRAATKNTPLEAGVYTIRVIGYEVPIADKASSYAVTWQWKPRGLKFTAFPEGFRYKPGVEQRVNWDITLAEDQDTLTTQLPQVYWKWKTDNWRVLSAANTRRHFNNTLKLSYQASSVNTNDLQLRLTYDDLEAVSNKASFVEPTDNRPQILAISPDKVKLSWTRATNTTQGKYYIFALYDKYITLVDSTEDLNTTTKEVAPPAGHQWTKDDFFAYAIYDSGVKARSLRSPLVNLDPFNNETNASGNVWNKEYYLCAGDTIRLTGNTLEGNLTWYRNDTPVSGLATNPRTVSITRDTPGLFYYTITSADNKVIYTSDTVKVNGVSLADTTQWGNNEWIGYVFKDPNAATTSLPLLKSGLEVYGRFTLKAMSFNSAGNLFGTDNSASTISTYQGCALPTDHARQVKVMKRTGFVPGTYTFRITKTTGIAQIFFTDADGNSVSQTSAVNSTGETAITVRLNEQSACEIHWLGSELNFALQAYTADTSSTYQPNRFYRLECAYPEYVRLQSVSKSIYLDYTDSKPKWQTTDKTSVGQLWYLSGLMPNLMVMNPNTLSFISSAGSTSSAVVLSKFNSLGSTQYNIVSGGQTLHTNQHNSGSGIASNLVGFGGGANSASAWYLRLVESIDIKIGSAGFTTAYYPFAITVPNTPGLKVYTAYANAVNGEQIDLTQLNAGTSVAPKTPLILEGAAGTYTLPIDYANTTAANPDDFALKGVTAPQSIPASSYILAYDDKYDVAFFPVIAADLLAANKVYYQPASGTTSSGALKLSFGGLTNIKSTTTRQSADVLYDVSGRKITTPTRGVYIKADRTKVIVP